MRILLFIDTLGSGGKERMAVELMKGLKSKNIDFELVVFSEDIHYQEILNAGIVIHQIVRKVKKDISVFIKVFAICKKYKPNVVHCFDSMSAVFLSPVVKLLGCKFVNGLVINTPTRTEFFNKHLLRARLTFPFSNIIVGNCEAGLAAYKAPKRRSVCIHNGFDFKRVEILLPKSAVKVDLDIKTKYVVGMVASFSEYKDYSTYFAAAQLLLKKRRDITFLAIGRDTDCEQAKDFIDESNYEYFRLLGSKTNVESLINVMDVCVLSTFTEGISNAIMEYMALSKPVIATRGGGTEEILEDNITGFLVGPRNAIELSNKIERLITDEKLRLRMGEAGKRSVQNKFSIHKMVDQFILTYKELTGV